MRTLSYCVLIATLAYLALNGGEYADTPTLAISLFGIISSLTLMVKSEDNE